MKIGLHFFKSFLSIIVAINLFYNQSDFLDDYDRQPIFTEPTPSELNAAMMDWAFRDLPPTATSVLSSTVYLSFFNKINLRSITSLLAI
ncbi:MAG: hypothetical protein WBG90_14325 [Saonia sp.]